MTGLNDCAASTASSTWKVPLLSVLLWLLRGFHVLVVVLEDGERKASMIAFTNGSLVKFGMFKWLRHGIANRKSFSKEERRRRPDAWRLTARGG